MQEQSAHSQPAPVTQARLPYTAAELALIDQLARQTTRKTEIMALFPNRTVAAVKQQINAARHRLGLIRAQEAPPQRRSDEKGYTVLHPDAEPEYDDWHIVNREQQTAANEPFLVALFAAMSQAVPA